MTGEGGAAREPAPLLDVDGLHVHLGRSHVLQGVTFDVARGGVTALLGRNGVGKTTTARAVLGLVQRRGQIRFDGHDIGRTGTPAIVRSGISYVPEDREVFASLTVEENLRLAEQPGRTPDYDLVHELFPELRERRRQRAGTLSGGQQQMVALGRVLLGRSELLVVDEPTKGLSPRLVGEVTRALERVAEHTTVLLIEQNLAVVRRLARHVVVLDSGRVVHTGAADGLLADPRRTKELLGVASRQHAPTGASSAPSSEPASDRVAAEGGRS